MAFGGPRAGRIRSERIVAKKDFNAYGEALPDAQAYGGEKSGCFAADRDFPRDGGAGSLSGGAGRGGAFDERTGGRRKVRSDPSDVALAVQVLACRKDAGACRKADRKREKSRIHVGAGSG